MKDVYNNKVVDLFCGAGGFSKGFEMAGFDVISGLDNYEKGIETWDINHNAKSLCKDITSISPEEYIKKVDIDKSDVDVIIGGPPCKDFSVANKKVDLGRNNLVILFAEYVKSLEPKAFVMENVKQLTTQYDDVLNDMIDKLSSYTVEYKTLDAADYGVPQHRIRTFVIGIHSDLELEPKFPEPICGPDSKLNNSLVTSGESISEISEPSDQSKYEVKSKHSDLLPEIPPGMNYSYYTEKLNHPEPQFDWRSRFSDYLYKADPEKPVRTLKAKPGAASGPFHWNNRRFTEKELMRLQGFPDSFSFSTDSYGHIQRMIGNSVPPKQSYYIAKALDRQINNVNLIDSDTNLNFISRKRTSTEEYEKKAEERISNREDYI